MANAYDARWRVSDANGNAIVGALLYVKNAGTATLSDVWSDTALSVPAANPLTSDANGFFPQFYVAEGSLYDFFPKTSAGVTLNRDCLSVAGVGSSSSALVRDFTNARFQVRGSGGTVFVEAGDASPDNVGGTMSVGGWAGTQADVITLNGAIVNVVGRLKENGYKVQGVVRTEAVTFSAVASVDIPLTNDPTGVRVFDIDIIDLISNTTNTTLNLRFSYDGGISFVSTAVYLNVTNFATGASPASSGNGTLQTSGLIAAANFSTGTTNVKGELRMRVTTSDGSQATIATGTIFGSGTAASTAPSVFQFGVTAAASAGRATHVRLISDHLISGLYRVSPQRGFGET